MTDNVLPQPEEHVERLEIETTEEEIEVRFFSISHSLVCGQIGASLCVHSCSACLAFFVAAAYRNRFIFVFSFAFLYAFLSFSFFCHWNHQNLYVFVVFLSFLLSFLHIFHFCVDFPYDTILMVRSFYCRGSVLLLHPYDVIIRIPSVVSSTLLTG